MAIVRWKPRTRLDPFAELMGMNSDIDRLFGSMLSRGALDTATQDKGAWTPALDVYEIDGKVVVKAELPGMSQEDIEVEFLENTLTIKGEKKWKEEKKERRYHLRECVYGSFHRSITLPEGIESAKATATFKGGTLEIELPKAKAPKPRHIKVNQN